MAQHAAHVLVTGGPGYLGSILCEHLLDAGHRVRPSITSCTASASKGLFHLCANPGFDFVKGDVRDEDADAPAGAGKPT